jgi:hypothetical protein
MVFDDESEVLEVSYDEDVKALLVTEFETRAAQMQIDSIELELEVKMMLEML